jgi:hypothetical protein
MNIFFLDLDPVKSARYHCDKHVIKMITEYSQIISTAIREHYHKSTLWRTEDLEPLYKSTHKNHPMVKWAMERWVNVLYLAHLNRELIKEYHFRYGDNPNFRKSKKLLKIIIPGVNLQIYPKTIPQCMPDEFKRPDLVEAYRTYYKEGKTHLHKWAKRGKPQWL